MVADNKIRRPAQHLMQRKTTRLQEHVSKTGLSVSTKKLKVMRISSQRTEPITIDEQDLDETGKFTCLGGVVTNGGARGGGEDIANRIGKARTKHGNLCTIQSEPKFVCTIQWSNHFCYTGAMHGRRTKKIQESLIHFTPHV